MDGIRASIDILPGDSDAPPDLAVIPRARLSRGLANRLLEAQERTDTPQKAGSVSSTDSSLDGLALCVEFEKTVEDQELWQSAFGNGLAEETLEERRKRDVSENRQRGKDVLLIWPDVTVSAASLPSRKRLRT